jgi:hypothetical protein
MERICTLGWRSSRRAGRHSIWLDRRSSERSSWRRAKCVSAQGKQSFIASVASSDDKGPICSSKQVCKCGEQEWAGRRGRSSRAMGNGEPAKRADEVTCDGRSVSARKASKASSRVLRAAQARSRAGEQSRVAELSRRGRRRTRTRRFRNTGRRAWRARRRRRGLSGGTGRRRTARTSRLARRRRRGLSQRGRRRTRTRRFRNTGRRT